MKGFRTVSFLKAGKLPVLMARKSVTKAKKKQTLSVLAPGFLNSVVVGNIPLEEPAKAVGRKFYTNLMPLTNDFKKQIIDLGLQVDKVVGDKLETSVWAFRIKASFVKRVVRKNRDRIDLVLDLASKDRKLVRMKLLFVTNANTYKSVNHEIRLFSEQFAKQYLSTVDVTTLTQHIIDFKMQAELRNSLHKIYPLKACLVRSFHVVRDLKDDEANDLEELAKARAAFVEQKKEEEKNKPPRKPRGRRREAPPREEAKTESKAEEVKPKEESAPAEEAKSEPAKQEAKSEE